MHMRRNLKRRMMTALLLALLLSCANLPQALVCALAEQPSAPELQILGSIEPSMLAAPGEVTLTLTITNPSDDSVHNLTLSTPDGQATQLAESLEAEGSAEVACAYPVSQAELDAGTISCIVVCETGGNRFSYPLNIAILKEQIVPEVEFLRHISGNSVPEGNAVTVVYLIRNTGNVAVSSISVTDPLGEYVGEAESLGIGESISLISRVYPAEDAVSAPVLEYSVGSAEENVYTARLDDAEIHIVQSALDAVLTAGRSIFSTDSSEVILTLTNSGDTDYRQITVLDDLYGGVIAEGLTLNAGDEPLEIVHSYPLRQTSAYRWRVLCSTSAGDELDFVTNEAEVAADDVNDVLLVLNADVSKPRINRKGYVTFTLELSIIGSGFATQVQVNEAVKGEVASLAVVPSGEPTIVTVRYDIREDSEFLFSATYLDENGQERTATAEPVLVEIVPNGEKPEKQYVTEELTEKHPLVQSRLFLGLLIGSCVLLITLCVVLMIASLRERKERKERDAARKRKLREELGKTNRFTPIKQTINKKK